MKFDEESQTWTRTCCKCHTTVFHKSRAKCQNAEKLNKVCVSCSRSAIGKKNASTDTCPVCNETFGISKKLLPEHASLHNMTPEELWLKKHNTVPQKCRCGCNNNTTWANWKAGYSEFILGHNGNIYSSYSQEKASAISEKRSKSMIGKTNWITGLTAKTDERVAKLGKKTSETRRKLAEQNQLPTWNKGLTKETDARISVYATEQKERFALGEMVPWTKGLTKHTDDRIATMAEKVSLTHQSIALRNKLDEIKRLDQSEIRGRIEVHGTLTVVSLDGYKNDRHNIIEVKCKSCNNTFIDNFRRLQAGKCYKCHPTSSIPQLELTNWLKTTISRSVLINDRKMLDGQELDIYVPDLKFAIEFNGLYWHSLRQKSLMYHQNKTTRAKKINISLMHVFEDEWRDKPEIVKSMITAKLGILQRSVYARKCEIVVLSSQERKAFFTANHIDGDVAASITFGLKDNVSKEIVAALSLRRPFHSRKATLEIARCCSVINTNVVGGVGKLVAAAIKHCKSNNVATLITYVDLRHGGTGVAYERAGFKFIKSTAIRFWWTDFYERFNRFKYKADKKNGRTEKQVAEEAGVVKIFCCRNNVYELSV